MKKQITIIGAGLVGSLCSLYMSKRGYDVNVFERRRDLRNDNISAGKSINLALSKRGWTALERVGVDKDVMKIAIPVYKRIMHDKDGNLTHQQYGKKDEAIYSVSRSLINLLMMDLAEKNGAKIFFNEKCVDINFKKTQAIFENTNTKKTTISVSDFIIGADGAFSEVRKKMVEKLKHEYTYDEIEHDYKELLIPAGENNKYLMDKNALHIWPRGNFMLMALANLDGSFTCTLFAPKTGNNSFEKLKDQKSVEKYFTKNFLDFSQIVPDLYEQWKNNPTSKLGIIKTYPWHYKNNTILVGDSAHATVPFYGQGMNCGFEDCRILDELLEKHENIEECFNEYSQIRKPNGDGVQELSMHNFIVMRDKTADPNFLLQKKIENKFSKKYPELWQTLYSMVSFTNIEYSKAIKIGEKQENIMKTIMQEKDIHLNWDSEETMKKIKSLIT